MNLSELSRACALGLGGAAFLCFASIAPIARADAPSVETAGRTVIVKIRAIRASGVEAAQSSSASANSSEPKEDSKSIDNGLEDIASKLKNLKYRNFKLVCSQQAEVPLMKKRTVYLVDGNSLTVRPLYIDQSKVGLWLRWLDGAGMRVLDTRVHLHEGESVITGTDGHPEPESKDETGLVLAIEVKAAQ